MTSRIEHGRRRTVPDVEYADLTLAMRTGEQPETVFDALTPARPDPHPRRRDRTSIRRSRTRSSPTGTTGRTVAVVASTREQVS